MKHTLEEVKTYIEVLACKINAPANLLPTYGYSLDFAQPHIEIDGYNGQLYYVIVERGNELRRDYAADLTDWAYKVFEDVTFSMASDFELAHRIESEDSRQQLFEKQEELLGVLSMEWQQRKQKDHQFILSKLPFS